MSAKKHRTNPNPDTICSVKGYPRKLTLYKCDASPYWYVRYYDKKIIRRSTRTTNKREAEAFAKRLYEEILLRQSQSLSIVDKSSFKRCAAAMLDAKKSKLARGEITKETVENLEYRLKKVVGTFGFRDVNDITYEDLEKYVTQLSNQMPELSSNTIDGYLKVIHQVFNQAHKMRLVQMIPHFPSVSKKVGTRGYFTIEEYRMLWQGARELEGCRFHYRKVQTSTGEEVGGYYLAGTEKKGRLIRSILITPELYYLIVFMVNSFIRPTDIKNLKHKHVEIIEDKRAYLRLTLPESKRHDTPIVTMAIAIKMYEKLTQHNISRGWGSGKDDYVFFPNQSRGNALKLLQQQFTILMWKLNIGDGPRGEERTIYSLRHTCIMFRLLYGENIDLVTLARNARTSPEMIDRHYASQLKGEDNIDMIQSRRERN